MRREWFRDAGLTLLVLVAQSGPFLMRPTPWPLLALLPVLWASLPVLFRRWNPAFCLLLSALGVGAYGFLETAPAQPIWFGALVCMYTVAYQATRPMRIASLAVTGIGMLLTIGSVNTAIREVATWSAAYALGALARARKEAAAANAVQAAQLAAERERTRIAQDLHDILGHAFSLMVVQAEAGAAVAKQDPARAEQAFDAISAAGRGAMDQLRALLPEERPKPNPAHTPALSSKHTTVREVSRAPQPGLSDIAALVRQVEQAGITIRLTESGSGRELSPQVQLATYRVVQEALTNVIKHAQARSVEVRLNWREGSFEVSIVDDGRGTMGEKGYGLAGIKERVTAAGGAGRVRHHSFSAARYRSRR